MKIKNKMKNKDKINKFFSEKYKQLREVSLYFTRNSELADELLHSCLLQLLIMKDKDLERIFNTNPFVYIYSMMSNQWINPTSNFHKNNNRGFEIIENYNYNIYNEDYDNEIDFKCQDIKKIVDGFEWWEKAIWNMYYTPADTYEDISGLTLSQTLEIRNISYRKIQKQMEEKRGKNGAIRHSTLAAIISRLNNKIRQQLKKNII